MPVLRELHILQVSGTQPLPPRRPSIPSSGRERRNGNNDWDSNSNKDSRDDDDDSNNSRSRTSARPSTVTRYVPFRATETVTVTSTPANALDQSAGRSVDSTAPETSPTPTPTLPVTGILTLTSSTPSSSITNAAASPSQTLTTAEKMGIQPGGVIAIIMGILFFITLILVMWVFGHKFHFPGHQWKALGKKETYHRPGRTISSFDAMKEYQPDGYYFTGGTQSKYSPWGQEDRRPRGPSMVSLPSFNLEAHEGSGPVSPSISPLDIPPFSDVSNILGNSSSGSGNFSTSTPAAPIRALPPVVRRTSLPSDAGSARSLPSVNEPRLVV